MKRVKNAKSLIVSDANTKIKPPHGSAHTLHTSARNADSMWTVRRGIVLIVGERQATMTDLLLGFIVVFGLLAFAVVVARW